MNVIAPDNEAIQALERSSLPLVIGADDLYYTKEDFGLERFRFANSRPSAISAVMQERIGAGKSEQGNMSGGFPTATRDREKN